MMLRQPFTILASVCVFLLPSLVQQNANSQESVSLKVAVVDTGGVFNNYTQLTEALTALREKAKTSSAPLQDRAAELTSKRGALDERTRQHNLRVKETGADVNAEEALAIERNELNSEIEKHEIEVVKMRDELASEQRQLEGEAVIKLWAALETYKAANGIDLIFTTPVGKSLMPQKGWTLISGHDSLALVERAKDSDITDEIISILNGPQAPAAPAPTGLSPSPVRRFLIPE